MTTTNGARSRDILLKELVALMHDLPREQLIAVSEYAHELQDAVVSRGTAEVLSATLDRVGPLKFEADELERLMDEIEAMRRLDLGVEEDDSVST